MNIIRVSFILSIDISDFLQKNFKKVKKILGFLLQIERDENAYTLREKYKEEKKFLKSRVSKNDREQLDFM